MTRSSGCRNGGLEGVPEPCPPFLTAGGNLLRPSTYPCDRESAAEGEIFREILQEMLLERDPHGMIDNQNHLDPLELEC